LTSDVIPERSGVNVTGGVTDDGGVIRPDFNFSDPVVPDTCSFLFHRFAYREVGYSATLDSAEATLALYMYLLSDMIDDFRSARPDICGALLKDNHIAISTTVDCLS
jgi:hypothetical protein